MLVKCNACPHMCGVERSKYFGICKSPQNMVVSRIGKHMWEEPCISGQTAEPKLDGSSDNFVEVTKSVGQQQGSGTIFFGGCNLRCRFCQNFQISRGCVQGVNGLKLTDSQFEYAVLKLQDSGVHNINLVSPSHFAVQIAKCLGKIKPKLKIPVVYNTNTYEKVDTLALLDGLVDVYLPDLKFCDSQLSKQLCGVENYFEIATKAIAEMRRQQPVDVFDDSAIIQKGVIVRHLILPSQIEDSKRILDFLADFDKDIYVSLMSQFFVAQIDKKYSFLNRKLTKREYNSVVEYFFNVGLKNGFMQQLSSATVDYLPNFDTEQVRQFVDD